MAKFFIFPFATTGDKTAIPDGTQVSGSVSYEQGFGFDYQRNLATDTLAKAVPRDQSNQLYFDITDNIQQYQTHGVPDFIEPSDNGGVPYPYDIYARVRYDDGGGFRIYENQVNANITDPTDPSWIVLSGSSLPVGTLLDYAGTVLPDGFLPCDGTTRSQASFPELYAVLGTIWGPDSGGNFTLPDFRRRTAVGSGGSVGGGLNATVGSTGGAETKTLGLNEMPDHTHVPPVTGGYDIRRTSGGDSNMVAGTQNQSVGNTGGVTGHAGSTSAFNLFQPSNVVLKIIKY